MPPADRLPPDLVRRLIVRAADPGRRIASPSQFTASLQLKSPDGLFAALRGAMSDLGRVVQANQAGRIDHEMAARAEEIERQMTTKVPQPAAAPEAASEAALAATETVLGFALPAPLRQLYAAVGNGGFGPGDGFFALADMVEEYRGQTGSPAGPRGQLWPAQLLPIVRMEPAFDCIDIATGEIIAWDIEELAEGSSNAHWARSFKPVAPDLAAYLAAWLDPPAEPGFGPADHLEEEEGIDQTHLRNLADALPNMSADMIAMIPEPYRRRLGLE